MTKKLGPVLVPSLDRRLRVGLVVLKDNVQLLSYTGNGWEGRVARSSAAQARRIEKTVILKR